MPWTKRSLHSQLKINYHSSLMVVLSYSFKQKEMLNILKVFSPNTMTYWAFKKKIRLRCPSYVKLTPTDLSIPNIRLQYLIFIYLFSYCIKRWLCSNFYGLPNLRCICIVCYLRCSKIHVAVVSVTLFTYTREINGFQWKRISVLFKK